MKKTINVNIGGMMFHLDDDAFEKCKSYLDTLKIKFGKMEGGSEIVEDIEIRIGEIFKERLSNIREVVSLEDVEEMVSIMGDPNSFIDDDTIGTDQLHTDNQPVIKRRLFRDPDKRVIGGVCSGFGAYFNIDPWIVRVIMICLVIFGGVSALLYFIFWIAMPKAVTTADRLMMKGKKVDVNSIEDAVKKEWNETKSGIKSVGRNARSSSFFNVIGKIFRISFGVFFIFFSAIVLAGFIWAMLSGSNTMHFDDLHLSMREGASMVFDNFGEKLIAYVSAWLLIVVPSVLFIYLGIRAILQFKHKLRYVMLGGFLLWIIGLIMAIYMAITVAEKYEMQANIKDTPAFNIADSSTIKITVLNDDAIPGYNLQGYPMSLVDLDIVKNTTDSFPVVEIERSSQGKDKQYAFDLAQKINYHYSLDSNQLELATYFMLGRDDKFRGQRVNVKLLLPVGYKVFLAKGTEKVIHGVDNVQNVWDGDMPEHTWTMTLDGLSCDDCPADITRIDHEENEEVVVDSLGNVTVKVKHTINDEGDTIEGE
jgi:phage shock protein PspC (stress-responsive transcriptional regulator)